MEERDPSRTAGESADWWSHDEKQHRVPQKIKSRDLPCVSVGFLRLEIRLILGTAHLRPSLSGTTGRVAGAAPAGQAASLCTATGQY